jgi:hypothetical protein
MKKAIHISLWALKNAEKQNDIIVIIPKKPRVNGMKSCNIRIFEQKNHLEEFLACNPCQKPVEICVLIVNECIIVGLFERGGYQQQQQQFNFQFRENWECGNAISSRSH